MQTRQVLKDIDRASMAALTRRTNHHGLIHLLAHIGLLIGLLALAWLCWANTWNGGMTTDYLAAYIGFAVMGGIVMVFLFTPMHEASHMTAFKTPLFNHLVMHMVGILLILPPRWFTYFHRAHHTHTQDPDHDPELSSPKPNDLPSYLWHLSGFPVWASQLKALLRNATGRCDDAYIPQAKRRAIRTEAQVMLLIYAGLIAISISFQSLALIYLWVIPALLGQPFLRAYLMAEHGGCDFVSAMLQNSRTTKTTAIVKWLAWNMPYHAEHHSLPAVPFHQLPKLHGYTKPYLAHFSDGYRQVHQDLINDFGKSG